MRQKRRHTWTVSFVEVPLGPLRAGGAPESTKQPRYPGTEGQGRGVCLVPRTSAPAGARPPLRRPTHCGSRGCRSSASRCPPRSRPRSTTAAHRHPGSWGGQGVQIALPANPPCAPRGPAALGSARALPGGRWEAVKAPRAEWGFRPARAVACSPRPAAAPPLPRLRTPLPSRSGDFCPQRSVLPPSSVPAAPDGSCVSEPQAPRSPLVGAPQRSCGA